MEDWAKVVVYPLGFCGFALFLLWRINAYAAKNGKPAPVFFQVLAGVSLVCGLGLAYLQISKSGSVQVPGGHAESTAPAEPATVSPAPEARTARSIQPAAPAAATRSDQDADATPLEAAGRVVSNPPPQQRMRLPEQQTLDLSGDWTDSGDGNTVSITQNGRSVTARIAALNAMVQLYGGNASLVTFSGALRECAGYIACLDLATPSGARVALQVQSPSMMKGIMASNMGIQQILLVKQ